MIYLISDLEIEKMFCALFNELPDICSMLMGRFCREVDACFAKEV